MLAEIYGMDIFCIGTELMKTTGPEHEQAWRYIIQQIKQVYKGPLVYAANWWLEYEQIRFWDELDYLGLNCYAPLSDKDNVTYKELKKGAERYIPTIARVARDFNKPVLFTEIGFTSTAHNWKEPHKSDRRATPYFEDQVRCYRAIFETFWEQDWFYGFYWWKWPTYMEDGGLNSTGITPAGKPAAKVIQEWYSKTSPEKNGQF